MLRTFLCNFKTVWIRIRRRVTRRLIRIQTALNLSAIGCDYQDNGQLYSCQNLSAFESLILSTNWKRQSAERRYSILSKFECVGTMTIYVERSAFGLCFVWRIEIHDCIGSHMSLLFWNRRLINKSLYNTMMPSPKKIQLRTQAS